MSDDVTDAALSPERIEQARETLTEAFRLLLARKVVGAIEARDAAGAMTEAKRNLTAIAGELHGREVWEKMLDT